MAQASILAGIYSDSDGDFRVGYPQNYVPVAQPSGISGGYMRPADGITQSGTGPGIGRGGIAWNGALYRVMGDKLCQIASNGTVSVLGGVAYGGQCSLDYGFDRLVIASGGNLYYWDGSALTQVTDPDLGAVVDVLFMAGYYVTTDGTYIVVTELNDPLSVNPLKYGSAESDPDPIKALDKLRNELYALGRYSIEVFENVGGELFPFARISGAHIPRGVIGTHAYCHFDGAFAFVGSARNEAPGVHITTAGDAPKISTREIDSILATYSEAQLSECVVEAKIDRAHKHLLIHLPDKTLVYDPAASAELEQRVWFVLHSGLTEATQYRARDLVWCYDRWNVADPTSAAFGFLSDAATHYGSDVGWQLSTPMAYLDGADGIVHELELVCLPGRVALGADPTVWASYSHDGETWSDPDPRSAGKVGDRAKRLIWRNHGRVRHYRTQRFTGTSQAHLPIARLEVRVETLGNKV